MRRLLRVPGKRVFDADPAFAEIDKRDERGHVACRNALSYTHCTFLLAAGTPEAISNAVMRNLAGASLGARHVFGSSAQP